MAQHTFGSICSVIGVSDSTTGRHYGSALKCTLNGQPAILTALHVIEEARREPFGLAVSTGYGEPPYVVQGPVNIDPFADIAVYFWLIRDGWFRRPVGRCPQLEGRAGRGVWDILSPEQRSGKGRR
jgi:hypothetical protein